jgi:branched-chain amino acid transport system substrate-binding protein
MRNTRKRGAGVLLLLATALLAASCSGGSSSGSALPAGPIDVGALLSLTGPNAAMGQAQEVMLQILVTNLNVSGGIAGHPVDLVTLNDEGVGAVAAQQANVLVREHVAAVVFAGTPDTLGHAMAVFDAHHVPVVMPDPEDQWADGARFPYFFDTGPLDKQMAAAMARFAKAKGLHKLAMIGDGSAVSSQLDTDLSQASAGQGLAVAAAQTFAPSAPSVVTQVQQLEASGADGLLVSAQSGLGTVYGALRRLHWSPTILTAPAAEVVDYPSLGALAPGAFSACSVAVDPGQQPPATASEVLQSVEAHVGPTPLALAALSYADGLQLLDKAIALAHSTSGPDIKAQLEQLKAVYTTAPYTYTFTAANHAGWASKNVRMCVLTGFGPYDVPVVATP